MIIFLLCLSILLGTVRNALSKEVGTLRFGTKEFFEAQSIIFISGTVLLALVSQNLLDGISLFSLLCAVAYGVMVITAQYCYTAALGMGNIGITSVVYSLGFIIPTICGFVFWNETPTVCKVLGILMVIPALVLSGKKKGNAAAGKGGSAYIVLLMIAMLAAGALGLVQKIHQTSPDADQLGIFLIVSFLMATVTSLVFSRICKPQEITAKKRKMLFSCGIGLAFGGCNILNTYLVGQMDSAVFFPVYNISVVVSSLLAGVLLFREKLTARDTTVILFGIASILLISLG